MGLYVFFFSPKVVTIVSASVFFVPVDSLKEVNLFRNFIE